ncbi:hypothetical protein CYMTET_15131 [Cymbomonas tetramitiformis]|uniref:Uncharacterized protein n=1 Tax=Cymbomonas tetramitiformis TaxID=36881 RepID=A0AAE0GEV5_9CHLO|nr:hypothetical protein CYMTET_15131 [Cymbomonas tetramitiformis]
MLNQYGDPPDTAYLGGSPLFNESTAVLVDRYVYLKEKFPDSPWSHSRSQTIPRSDEEMSKSRFPAHWGEPPKMQTKDLRTLPGDYGMGSSTLANWIQGNMEKDKTNQSADMD